MIQAAQGFLKPEPRAAEAEMGGGDILEVVGLVDHQRRALLAGHLASQLLSLRQAGQDAALLAEAPGGQAGQVEAGHPGPAHGLAHLLELVEGKAQGFLDDEVLARPRGGDGRGRAGPGLWRRYRDRDARGDARGRRAPRVALPGPGWTGSGGRPVGRFAAGLAEVTAVSASQTAAGRVPVQQATSAVQAREAALRITKSQRRPYVSVNSAFGEVAYSGLPGFDDWRTNWTVGASVQIPLFTGGRLKAEEVSAGADDSHNWAGAAYPSALMVDQGQGNAIRKRDEVHKMAQANKAFAHFAW